MPCGPAGKILATPRPFGCVAEFWACFHVCLGFSDYMHVPAPNPLISKLYMSDGPPLLLSKVNAEMARGIQLLDDQKA